jgi:hypothetical protein
LEKAVLRNQSGFCILGQGRFDGLALVEGFNHGIHRAVNNTSSP